MGKRFVPEPTPNSDHIRIRDTKTDKVVKDGNGRQWRTDDPDWLNEAIKDLEERTGE